MNTEEKDNPSLDLIIPGLWLGNEGAALSNEILQQHNISVIVNATKHIPCELNLIYYRVPVNDPGPTRDLMSEDHKIMLEHIPEVLSFIDYHLSKKRNILVHCHAGMQRSVSIVFLYLYLYVFKEYPSKQRLELCIKQIMRKRPRSFCYGEYSSFEPVLKHFIKI